MIFQISKMFGFEVALRWVPRELLGDADALSKAIERMDFGLAPDALEYVLASFGPVDVDRFAAPHNAVCARFNAKFDSPRVEAVDAFAQDWREGVSFLLPDFNKLDLVMDFVERDDVEAVLIVPEWSRKAFWRRIHSAPWRARIVAAEFMSGDALVPHPANARNCFFGEHFECRILIMRLRPLGAGLVANTPAAPAAREEELGQGLPEKRKRPPRRPKEDRGAGRRRGGHRQPHPREPGSFPPTCRSPKHQTHHREKKKAESG